MSVVAKYVPCGRYGVSPAAASPATSRSRRSWRLRARPVGNAPYSSSAVATAGFAPWAATAPDEVLARLGVRSRRPSEKTFRSVFARLDPADLDRRLGGYFTALAAAQQPADGRLLAVAVDGKTVRGARRAGASTAHLVSVFAHRARLVLGQLARRSPGWPDR